MNDRDVEAFIGTVREHDPSLRALAYRLVGNKVEDVLQDAYVRAFRGLDGFEGRSKLRTWLHKIVYNTCLDELKKPQLVQLSASDGQIPDGASSPEDQATAHVDVSRALEQLREEHRAAVWLVDGAGFSYRETAKILDLPEGTVSTWVTRGRTVLKAALRGEVEL